MACFKEFSSCLKQDKSFHEFLSNLLPLNEQIKELSLMFTLKWSII